MKKEVQELFEKALAGDTKAYLEIVDLLGKIQDRKNI